jgi:hypothetical protein
VDLLEMGAAYARRVTGAVNRYENRKRISTTNYQPPTTDH